MRGEKRAAKQESRGAASLESRSTGFVAVGHRSMLLDRALASELWKGVYRKRNVAGACLRTSGG